MDKNELNSKTGCPSKPKEIKLCIFLLNLGNYITTTQDLRRAITLSEQATTYILQLATLIDSLNLMNCFAINKVTKKLPLRYVNNF